MRKRKRSPYDIADELVVTIHDPTRDSRWDHARRHAYPAADDLDLCEHLKLPGPNCFPPPLATRNINLREVVAAHLVKSAAAGGEGRAPDATAGVSAEALPAAGVAVECVPEAVAAAAAAAAAVAVVPQETLRAPVASAVGRITTRAARDEEIEEWDDVCWSRGRPRYSGGCRVQGGDVEPGEVVAESNAKPTVARSTPLRPPLPAGCARGDAAVSNAVESTTAVPLARRRRSPPPVKSEPAIVEGTPSTVYPTRRASRRRHVIVESMPARVQVLCEASQPSKAPGGTVDASPTVPQKFDRAVAPLHRLQVDTLISGTPSASRNPAASLDEVTASPRGSAGREVARKLMEDIDRCQNESGDDFSDRSHGEGDVVMPSNVVEGTAAALTVIPQTMGASPEGGRRSSSENDEDGEGDSGSDALRSHSCRGSGAHSALPEDGMTGTRRGESDSESDVLQSSASPRKLFSDSERASTGRAAWDAAEAVELDVDGGTGPKAATARLSVVQRRAQERHAAALHEVATDSGKSPVADGDVRPRDAGSASPTPEHAVSAPASKGAPVHGAQDRGRDALPAPHSGGGAGPSKRASGAVTRTPDTAAPLASSDGMHTFGGDRTPARFGRSALAAARLALKHGNSSIPDGSGPCERGPTPCLAQIGALLRQPVLPGLRTPSRTGRRGTGPSFGGVPVADKPGTGPARRDCTPACPSALELVPSPCDLRKTGEDDIEEAVDEGVVACAPGCELDPIQSTLDDTVLEGGECRAPDADAGAFPCPDGVEGGGGGGQQPPESTLERKLREGSPAPTAGAGRVSRPLFSTPVTCAAVLLAQGAGRGVTPLPLRSIDALAAAPAKRRPTLSDGSAEPPPLARPEALRVLDSECPSPSPSREVCQAAAEQQPHVRAGSASATGCSTVASRATPKTRTNAAAAQGPGDGPLSPILPVRCMRVAEPGVETPFAAASRVTPSVTARANRPMPTSGQDLSVERGTGTRAGVESPRAAGGRLAAPPTTHVAAETAGAELLPGELRFERPVAEDGSALAGTTDSGKPRAARVAPFQQRGAAAGTEHGCRVPVPAKEAAVDGAAAPPSSILPPAARRPAGRVTSVQRRRRAEPEFESLGVQAASRAAAPRAASLTSGRGKPGDPVTPARDVGVRPRLGLPSPSVTVPAADFPTFTSGRGNPLTSVPPMVGFGSGAGPGFTTPVHSIHDAAGAAGVVAPLSLLASGGGRPTGAGPPAPTFPSFTTGRGTRLAAVAPLQLWGEDAAQGTSGDPNTRSCRDDRRDGADRARPRPLLPSPSCRRGISEAAWRGTPPSGPPGRRSLAAASPNVTAFKPPFATPSLQKQLPLRAGTSSRKTSRTADGSMPSKEFKRPRRIAPTPPRPSSAAPAAGIPSGPALLLSTAGTLIAVAGTANRKLTRRPPAVYSSRHFRPPLSMLWLSSLAWGSDGLSACMSHKFAARNLGDMTVLPPELLTVLTTSSPASCAVGSSTEPPHVGEGKLPTSFGVDHCVAWIGSMFPRAQRKPATRVGSAAWSRLVYSLAVWKLARLALGALEAGQSTGEALRYFSAAHVVREFLRRLATEWTQNKVPPLAKMMRRDSSPASHVVLVVTAVVMPLAGDVALEVSDGWHVARARLDRALSLLVADRKRIDVGDKLHVSNATLVDSRSRPFFFGDGDELGAADLKFCINGVRRVKRTHLRSARLGFQRGQGMFTTNLSHVFPLGGPVPCLVVVVQRVYPVQYVERGGGGRAVCRQEEAEDAAREVHAERIRQLGERRSIGRGSGTARDGDDGDLQYVPREVSTKLEFLVSGGAGPAGNVCATAIVWRPTEDLVELVRRGGAVLLLYSVNVDVYQGVLNLRVENSCVRPAPKEWTAVRPKDCLNARPLTQAAQLCKGGMSCGQEFDGVFAVVHIGLLAAPGTARYVFLVDALDTMHVIGLELHDDWAVNVPRALLGGCGRDRLPKRRQAKPAVDGEDQAVPADVAIVGLRDVKFVSVSAATGIANTNATGRTEILSLQVLGVRGGRVGREHGPGSRCEAEMAAMRAAAMAMVEKMQGPAAVAQLDLVRDAVKAVASGEKTSIRAWYSQTQD